MDNKKKITAISIFSVFIIAIAIYAKNAIFKEEEAPVIKQFTINTPNVDQSKIDSISKFDSYNKEAAANYDPNQAKMFADNEVQQNAYQDDYNFNPFKPSSNDPSTQENNNGQPMTAEQELMALLQAQAEMDAQGQANLIAASRQYEPRNAAPQPQPYYAPIEQKKEEPIPPSLSERWSSVKEQSQSFKGVGGMTTPSKALDLTPAESVDRASLKTNSTVAFRLKQDLYLEKQNLRIPKDAVLYGKTSFGGIDRMNIEISTYKTNNKIYPISLSIYDFDGRKGIHLGNLSWPKIPAKVAKDVSDYAVTKGTQQPVLGGNNNIDAEEIKTIATLSAVNTVLEEYVNKKRILMPQKYHVWIHIDDKN